MAVTLVGFGALALLAGQLIAGATILNVITGAPRWAGALIGGGDHDDLFRGGRTARLRLGEHAAAGGDARGVSWWRCPSFLATAGGVSGARRSGTVPTWFGDITYSAGPGSGWTLLALTGPAFIVSPGLIQKAFGADSARSVRLGVGLNAVALLLFAFIPVLMGMAARVLMPGIADPNAVLPTLLAHSCRHGSERSRWQRFLNRSGHV